MHFKELPLFYMGMLQYKFEFKDVQKNKMPRTEKKIILNIKKIKIDNKSVFLYFVW